MLALKETLILILITAIPALELRLAIPVGILTTTLHLPFFGDISGFGLPWWYVFAVVVLANIAVGIIGYFALDLIVHRLLLPHWPWFNRFYHRQVERVQKKIHSSVERFGWLGLALFIGVPLPGTGVYSGAVAGYALGMEKKHYILATVLGVVIAAVLVTILTLGLKSVFS
jgi:uncharacterized membrane protein